MTMSTPLVDAPLRRAPGELPAFQPVVVADERCKGCGLCVDACPPGVLVLDERFVNAMGHHVARLVDADACTSCAKCARVCPDAVLTIYARPKEA
ncbi:MAG TPA: 4Fe-4S dicluster domain-containing protein [Candidatus Limnocylindrales bacterium]|jgi:2-oxoglutarate ferredoxin oxidoreductase subunit delta